MKKSEFRSLIREEVKKTLNEDRTPLPSGIHVAGPIKKGTKNEYVMYFSYWNWEPTIAELEKSLAVVYETLKKQGDAVGVVSITGKPTVFVRDGELCIGDRFTSTMKPLDMDKSVGLLNF